MRIDAYSKILSVIAACVVILCAGFSAASQKPPDQKLSPEKEAKRAAFLEQAMASIPKEGEDKTLSPYFFVMSDDPKTDQLPMKSTRADVDIAGVIAGVKVTQVYKNTGKNTLEAIYIFPASSRAAVYAMKMTIGTRVIEAEIREKEKARKEYEQARKEGRTASLLEQMRPNVFQMNVANILPGDEIKVEMFYTELLVPEDNIYEFIYPTVVGPRYSNVKETDATPQQAWTKNPYLHEGQAAPYTFGIDVNITSGMPISQVASPSHASVTTEFADKTKAHVALKESTEGGNRDFVLRYSLAGDQIESGLLLYKGKDENFFLTMVEPPKRVEPAKIVPREYIFICDISGSMHGFPLDITKKLMRELFGNLKSTDYFNVLLFAGSNAVLAEKSLSASKDNIEKAIAILSGQTGGGGTELVPALKRALALPRTKGTSRIMVIATDGYVSVEKDAFELIRSNLSDANLFAFGIGSSVNRYLIEGMARAGMGEPFILLNQGEAPAKAAKFKQYIAAPVLNGIKVDFKGFDAYDVEPKSIPDLFAKRPLIVYGKYKGEPSGNVVVTGTAAGQKFEKSLAASPALESPKNEALKYLWARERIMWLGDMNRLDKSDARVKEITDLGLKYHLMTAYTSFIAVDKIVRADGKYETVKQPLPLPQGVSDLAVGDGGMMPGMAMAVAPMPMRAGSGTMMKEMAKPEEAVTTALPVLTVDRVTVLEGADAKLTVDEIKKVIVASALESCAKSAKAKNAALSGTITFKLTIDKEGKVAKVEPMTNSTGDAALATCLAGKLKLLAFIKPATSSAVVAEVTLRI